MRRVCDPSVPLTAPPLGGRSSPFPSNGVPTSGPPVFVRAAPLRFSPYSLFRLAAPGAHALRQSAKDTAETLFYDQACLMRGQKVRAYVLDVL